MYLFVYIYEIEKRERGKRGKGMLSAEEEKILGGFSGGGACDCIGSWCE